MQISGIFLCVGMSALLWGMKASAGIPIKNPDTTIIGPPKNEKLQWLTLAEAEAKIASRKKAIVIDLYTDWCGWCKVMDRNTYTNPNVVQYIHENFYPVVFIVFKLLSAPGKHFIRFGV